MELKNSLNEMKSVRERIYSREDQMEDRIGDLEDKNK